MFKKHLFKQVLNVKVFTLNGNRDYIILTLKVKKNLSLRNNYTSP